MKKITALFIVFLLCAGYIRAQVFDLKNAWDVSVGGSYITSGFGLSLEGNYYFSPSVNMGLAIYGSSLRPFEHLDRELMFNISVPVGFAIKLSRQAGIILRPSVGIGVTLLNVYNHDFESKQKPLIGASAGLGIEKTLPSGWGLVLNFNSISGFNAQPVIYYEWWAGLKIKKYFNF